MAMNPRLLVPRASGLRFNPANLVLVFDTSLETANLTVSVPINNVSGSPNVTIDWGDGTTSTATTNGFVTKTYATPGIKVVQVSGTMTRLSYGTGASSTNNKMKLVRCLSFGNLGITQLNAGFHNCPNLIQVPASLPTTSNVTTLATCFQGCTSFNDARVGSWNTAAVTTLNNTFRDASAFNQPIGSWNTSLVANMNGTFLNATSFNQDIGSWNTANVTNMGFMFQNASAFNQSIGSWDTANVVSMTTMLNGASAFNQNISGWDIRKVTTMSGMFTGSTWGTANYDAALEAWAALPDDDLNSQAITAFAASSSNTLVTSNNHGMVAGSRVNISGTTNYNGDYNVVSVPNVNQFVIPTAFVSNDATGTMKHRRSRNVVAGFGTNKYSAGAAADARNVLINTYGWTITDGGQA